VVHGCACIHVSGVGGSGRWPVNVRSTGRSTTDLTRRHRLDYHNTNSSDCRQTRLAKDEIDTISERAVSF